MNNQLFLRVNGIGILDQKDGDSDNGILRLLLPLFDPVGGSSHQVLHARYGLSLGMCALRTSLLQFCQCVRKYL